MMRQIVRFCIAPVVFTLVLSLAQQAEAQTVKETKALLVTDFAAALDSFAEGAVVESIDPKVNVWIKGLRDRGVDPEFIRNRLARKESLYEHGGDRFAAYRTLKVEQFVENHAEAAVTPVALHAFRLDVIEDYDDVMNDDIYSYFIVTHDDLMWGKVTSIYRGLDEGDSVFLTPEDRGIFGPHGEKIAPKNHTIVDYGIIESDGEDIQQLHKISDAIVDLAVVALSIYDPQAGASAAQAREETKNLLRLIIELDDDDRLVTDTIRFTPDLMMTMLSGSSAHEFAREHDRSTFWTSFAYRINFRMLR